MPRESASKKECDGASAGALNSGCSEAPGIWRALLWLTFAAALLHLVVLGVRLGSLAQHSDLVLTSGIEEPCIYSVWKVINGHPLYEWPNQGNYALSLYNFGFYESYAAFVKLCGANDAGILLYGRLFTLAFAVFGAVGQWRLMCRLCGRAGDPNKSLLLAAVAVLTWFGYLVSWYPLTVRPDIAAVALAVWGLLAYVGGLQTAQPGRFVVAALFFFLAWAFKQSTVWLLAGASLHAVLLRRQWREAALLIIPCGGLMALCLVLGSPEYRYNILVAPSINHYIPKQAVMIFLKGVGPTLLLWVGAVAMLGGWLRKVKPPVAGDALPEERGRLFAVVFGVSLVMSVVVCAKNGSTQNQLLEPYIVAGTLAGVWLWTLRGAVPKTTAASAAILMLLLVVLPVVQLAYPHGFSRVTWHLQRAAPEEYRHREAFARELKPLPKPLYVRDGVFALPWHANDGHYPAFVLDEIYYFPAQFKGLLRGGGIEQMVKDRKFRSLALAEDDGLFRMALAAGYRRDPVPFRVPSALTPSESTELWILRANDGN